MTEFPRERTAIVTGAASERGIGRAIAGTLAAHGWSVAVFDTDDAACRELAAELRERHGVECLGTGVDIRERAAVFSAVDAVRRTLPQLIGLVNNAGVSSPVPFLDVTDEEWRRVVEVNLHGTFHVTQASAKVMAARGVGRIVQISSTSAERGGGVYGRAAYSASKAALLGFARTLARELGPSGITSNAVAPGSIDTDIMGGRLTEERKALLLRELPVGRIGTVHDVAAVVSFLLGESAGYVTGVTYDVNGGSHIA
ncbi:MULTISPECIES: SDR family NAD(P)-dependent oxidoreductase [unclassified Saccharopolyspora]|uniref:SDR family NAD(P)-dependent oxidoreductase n=1 Tax=unclassified Saccharopolyspora TaxID=2646250 RepID=UPI001CD56387|nr:MULTISPECIES: SDR family NAD(P)-dependent oxidoreductase [unclassified Saccharopolyspora]MCA1187346.1 SDR family oxidoreductase [Saccharopolyspora sp. 6T]MCA1228856.1 SDR family oxidoreductase [Saccharopolyspora sp. 6M]